MTADDYTGGEIKRGFDRIEKQLTELAVEVRTRHHNLANQVATATGPISALTFRLDRAEEDVQQLCQDVKRLDQSAEDSKMQGARIGGIVAAAVIVGNVLMWAVTTFWKH